jgi:fatty-acid desaturase
MSEHKQNLYGVFYPVHLVTILWVIFGTHTWNAALYAFIGWVVICGLGSAVGLHRVISHRAEFPAPWKRNVLTVLACLCVQGPPIWWASVHRSGHHRFSDTERDPHTPLFGRWFSYHGWLHKPGVGRVNVRYLPDLLRDHFLVECSRTYPWIVYGVYANAWFINPEFLLWGLMVPAVWSYHQESIVNTLCHYARGERWSMTKDASVNRKYLALVTWGQALHNNHHARPGDFDFSLGQKGKFDPCAIFKILMR